MTWFRTLRSQADSAMIRQLSTIADRANQTLLFNPSIVVLGDVVVFAYRAIPAGRQSIRSYVAVTHRDRNGDVETLSDLTTAGEERGLKRVADPKLFIVGGAVYATFNTGFAPRGTQNDIYVMRVFPTLGPMQRVVADFQRQEVEKNWAFGGQARDFRAIYQLHPYSEAVLVDGELGETSDLHFKLRTVSGASSVVARGLTIGTQMISARHDRVLLLAHERWSLGRKRSYFGHAVTVNGFGTANVSVDLSRKRLIHSVRDALPRRGIHNPNLLSATYFSGLARDEDDVILGYGINDTDFSIARLKEDDLWS